jgi:dihydrofolate reductase
MKITLLAALTADGFISKSADHLTDWTSPEDKQLFVRLTKAAGVMVMGSKTFKTINKALPGRRTIVYTSRPEAIKVTGVETTSESPQALISRLDQNGVNGLIICGGAQIYTLFMNAGCVDELYITISPRLFGTGQSLFTAEVDQTLELIDSSPLGPGEVLLRYALHSPR